MIDVNHLLDVADAYARISGIEEKTVSNRVFQDSKKLAAIRDGSDITVGRFNSALAWFAANWPEGGVWPSGVHRPSEVEATPYRRSSPQDSPEQGSDHLRIILETLAGQMESELGFVPSHVQVVQFLARKAGISIR